MLDTLKAYQMMQDEDIMLSYKGALDGEMIDILLQMAEKRLTMLKAAKKTRKKIINILVECLQNSFHYAGYYASATAVHESPFLILSRNQEKNYELASGNYVSKENTPLLEEKINLINRLNEEELQRHYLEVLNKDVLPISGGAGLGLIEVVRKSGKNIHFDIQEADEAHMLFILKVEIKEP